MGNNKYSISKRARKILTPKGQAVYSNRLHRFNRGYDILDKPVNIFFLLRSSRPEDADQAIAAAIGVDNYDKLGIYNASFEDKMYLKRQLYKATEDGLLRCMKELDLHTKITPERVINKTRDIVLKRIAPLYLPDLSVVGTVGDFLLHEELKEKPTKSSFPKNEIRAQNEKFLDYKSIKSFPAYVLTLFDTIVFSETKDVFMPDICARKNLRLFFGKSEYDRLGFSELNIFDASKIEKYMVYVIKHTTELEILKRLDAVKNVDFGKMSPYVTASMSLSNILGATNKSDIKTIVDTIDRNIETLLFLMDNSDQPLTKAEREVLFKIMYVASKGEDSPDDTFKMTYDAITNVNECRTFDDFCAAL